MAYSSRMFSANSPTSVLVVTGLKYVAMVFAENLEKVE
jgi:hypothetical protein